MKKYENGEYLELSDEEITAVKKEESEYLLSGDYDETNSDTNTIKETATGKAIVLKDISPSADKLMIKVNGTHVSGRVVYKLGQNVWDEVCEYSSSGLYLYSKNFIHVAPETNYYLYCNSPVFAWEENVGIFTEITFYGNSEQELSKVYDVKRNSVITTPADCCYMKFKLYEQYGNTYNNDICINVSDRRINGTYEAYYEEDAYEASIDGNIAILKPDYPVVTIFTEDTDISLECEYNKDIVKVLAGKQDRNEMEVLCNETIKEEVSTISVTADKEGNAFELDELYACIKIPNPNDISPYVYFTDDIACYIGFGSLGTNNSTLLISWKREGMCANIEHHQYYNIFKTAKVVEITDDIAVNQLRLSVFSGAVFPIGTQIKVWGRKVQ